MSAVAHLGYSFLAMMIVLITGAVLTAKGVILPKGQRQEKLARKNGWVTTGERVESKYYDEKYEASTRDRSLNSESYWVGTYEYKVNGKTYTGKVPMFDIPPATMEILYDARHGNKIINTAKQGVLFKFIVMFPFIVFFVVFYILDYI